MSTEFNAFPIPARNIVDHVAEAEAAAEAAEDAKDAAEAAAAQAQAIAGIEEAIQRGSNSNGEFVRFADGTQICWHSITRTGIDIDTSLGGVFLSDVYTWNYPATFFGAPLISPFVKNVRQSGRNANTDAFIHASESTTLMQYRHAAWAAQNGVNVRAVLYAIGRWF